MKMKGYFVQIALGLAIGVIPWRMAYAFNPSALSTSHSALVFYHTDHLGSSTVVTDLDGLETERLAYFPFGEAWKEWSVVRGLWSVYYKYTGQELDPESGLYYYGARYYDQGLGRFISMDPAGEDANPYAYVLNNPVRYTDPEGEGPYEPEEFDWKQWRIGLDRAEGIDRLNKAGWVVPRPWREVTDADISTLPEELQTRAFETRRIIIRQYIRYRTDPEYKRAMYERVKALLESDPEYKERCRKLSAGYEKARRKFDTEWYEGEKGRKSEYQRDRYAKDEEYRKTVKKQHREEWRRRYWLKKGYSEPPPKSTRGRKPGGVVGIGVITLWTLLDPDEERAIENYASGLED